MTSKLLEVSLRDGGGRDALKRLEARLDDLSPVFREIAGILFDVTQENFRLGGQPSWLPLAPATIRARTKDRSWPGRILIGRLGILIASVHQFSTNDAAIISAATPYAEIQQLGGTIERAARSGSLRLRTKANGDLVRQGGFGTKKNLAVFARSKGRNPHKRYNEVGFSSAAHSITIPARPYLPMTAEGELQPEADTGILGALNTYLQAAWES